MSTLLCLRVPISPEGHLRPFLLCHSLSHTPSWKIGEASSGSDQWSRCSCVNTRGSHLPIWPRQVSFWSGKRILSQGENWRQPPRPGLVPASAPRTGVLPKPHWAPSDPRKAEALSWPLWGWKGPRWCSVSHIKPVPGTRSTLSLV
jgi:hypothetical protein